VSEQWDRIHRRVVARGLRAELAVLGAAARLGGQDPLDLDDVAAPRQAHLVREGSQRRVVGVGHTRQVRQLVERQLAPIVEQRPSGGVEQFGRGWHGR
jgi:hypothetical protein